MAGKRTLPEQFKTTFRELLGEEELERYEACLQEPMTHGLRVNTGRITAEDLKKLSPWTLTPVPWCPTGFYLDTDAQENPPSKHPFYYAGAYYLQEPSAMLPAAALPVEPGDRVLDLCAAPGGKSTALAEKLHGTGLLVSNDVSASRAKALIRNLEMFGAANILVTCETADRLADHFGAYFDKILIDAPCSGEGMFRKSQTMITAWEQGGPEKFIPLQRSILKDAVRMLRPGGMLLYSTCTFHPGEDEQAVEYLLSLDPDLTLVPLPEHPGFLSGRPDWGNDGIEEMKYTKHLFPHRIKGEGHFAALFRKADHGTGFSTSEREILRGDKLTEDILEFLKEFNFPIDEKRLYLKQNRLSLLPKDENPKTRGLRVLRYGLFMGEQKKGRFDPSQALAMTLRPEDYKNSLNLSVEDDRVVRYLRGETLEYEKNELKDGRVMIFVEGMPLGFGKAKDGRIKNKYLPGWRMT